MTCRKRKCTCMCGYAQCRHPHPPLSYRGAKPGQVQSLKPRKTAARHNGHKERKARRRLCREACDWAGMTLQAITDTGSATPPSRRWGGLTHEQAWRRLPFPFSSSCPLWGVGAGGGLFSAWLTERLGGMPRSVAARAALALDPEKSGDVLWFQPWAWRSGALALASARALPPHSRYTWGANRAASFQEMID
jgi:hypothetical protein